MFILNQGCTADHSSKNLFCETILQYTIQLYLGSRGQKMIVLLSFEGIKQFNIET